MATIAHEISRRGLANVRDDDDSLVYRVDALHLALCSAADDSHKPIWDNS